MWSIDWKTYWQAVRMIVAGISAVAGFFLILVLFIEILPMAVSVSILTLLIIFGIPLLVAKK